MATTSSHRYKTERREKRQVINEGIFTGGMNFTDNPLGPGISKLLVNYIQKDAGQRIRPRGGWRQLADPILLGSNLGELYFHHAGVAFVRNTVTQDTFLRRYALYLQAAAGPYGSLTNSKVLIEEPLAAEPYTMKVSSLKGGATVYTIKHDDNDGLNEMHDMKVEANSPEGMFSSIDGNTYLMTNTGLGRLNLMYDGANYTHEVEMVTPLAVTPTQAVNYGYNMLKADPYAFPNTVKPTFMPEGILPYDTVTGKIKMQARVGEPVRFKLVYGYQTGKTYKVKWEIQDIYKRDGVNLVDKDWATKSYAEGAECYVDANAHMKQFSVIATVYDATDMVNPLRTVLLASYNLADDNNNVRMEQKTFDLKTATGMTTWKNQVVYWGVKGAELSIFISDINDPTYVPFPNNHVLCNDRVLKAFPYMESLMVQTEGTAFLVNFDSELGYTIKPVQMSMQLRDDDKAAMLAVRNMVCFKSKGYFYMIVPNIKNDRGELQIAPISDRITQLLDHFSQYTREILSEVYTLRQLFNAPNESIVITLQDYKSYAEGNRLRHVYKMKLSIFDVELYVDFHLIYDTIFRTWTLEIIESTRRPLQMFQAISTGYAQFLSIYTEGTNTYVQWLGIDENNPEDLFNLDEGQARMIQNFQAIDTGKRDLSGNLKKRVRQVILEFNNLNKSDVEFNHVLFMDDEQRSDLFNYDIVHVTDPMDPNYGQIYVERSYVDPTIVHGTTKLGFWSLGNSMFPEQTVIKVHLDVSGQGYYPRIRIITRASKLYELNTISWALRMMNAR